MTNWVSGRLLHPSTEPVVANLPVSSAFLVDGQVGGLGTVHPVLTKLFQHMISSSLQEKDIILDGWTAEEKKISE